jgi:predicted nuclease of predicted toxin-antitoxin system
MWVDLEQLLAAEPPPRLQSLAVHELAKRKAKPRFYADENFPSRATNMLRADGAKVSTAQDAQMLHYPDEAHAAYALRQGLILITCDRDFLDERRFPLVRCPAIYVFQFGGGSDDDMRSAFQCLASAFTTPQLIDKWMKVDASVNEWTERVRHLDGTTSRTRYRYWQGTLQEWVSETV